MKDNWVKVQLSDILKVSSGQGLIEENFKVGNHLIYGGNGIIGTHNSFTNLKSELIIGRVGALCGNVFITAPQSWITDNALIVRFNNIADIDLTFWYYLLSYARLGSYAFQSAQPVITGGIIDKIRILLPPLPQQQKIAKILSTCDEVIEKTEAAIAKYKAIKQGMMQDLFTRGMDVSTGKLRPSYQEAPELYKESELGMIPKEWEVQKLENYISLLKSGLSRLLSQQDIGIPVITSGNIQNGKIVYHDLKFWYLNDPQGASTATYILEKDDILLCFINSLEQIGKLAIFEGFYRPCIYTTNLFRIKSKAEHNSKFLFYLLSSVLVQDEIQLITKPAVNQASFTTKDFLNISVPSILLNEQLKIKENLETLDEKLQAEESSLSKYKKLKEGLMQDLLTGKVEVSE